MEDLEKDLQNTQRNKGMGDDEVSSEEEINLIDYLRVLRKHKYLILFGSVPPALIVGLIFFFSPGNYKVTYVYDVKDEGAYDVRDRSAYDVRDRGAYDVRDRSISDVSNWSLNEKNYTILLNRFYSAENASKIITKLQENGLSRYANRINTAGLKNFVEFEVSPPYMDLSKAQVADPIELEELGQLSAQLLNMTIIARPKKDIPKISLVTRDNLEKVIPVYLVEEQLNAIARAFKVKMASIEENRFNLELELNTNKNVLVGLKNIKPEASDQVEGSITLQFDVGDRSEYLPLGYQILAAESKIVELEENIKATEEKYSYYKDLLALNGKLLEELEKKRTSNYTIQNFRSFLINLVGNYKDKKLTDYLNSYIKKIENKISASVPVTEQPQISAISKGTVKKSAIVFAIALMISVFAAFLSEGIQKSQAQAL